MNALPIVHRELRLVCRKPWIYWSRSIFALAGMIAVLVMFYEDSRRGFISGDGMLWMLSVVTLILVLFYGCLLTADCISSEKREDTLGLLFLTNLKGYDIIAGKLSTHAITTATWLLAAFPVFFLPILAGGVSWAETVRVLLAIAVSFLFALTLGVWISTRSHDARNAVMSTLTVVSLIVVLPLLWLVFLDEVLRVNASTVGIAQASPAMLLYHARQPSSGTAYWVSIGMFLVASGVLACLASKFLPQLWREEDHRVSPVLIPKARRLLRFRGPRRRWRFLSANPFEDFFLHRFTRSSWAKIPLRLLLALFVLLVVLSFGPGDDEAFVFAMLIVYAFHVVAKFVFAFDATRSLSDDRRNSALELLSITTLGERAVAQGQAQAFKRRFKGAVRGLLVLTLVLQFVAMVNSGIGLRGDDFFLFGAFLWGPMIWTWSDYRTMAWLGMRHALRQTTHLRATLFTLAEAVLMPWAPYFLALFMMAESHVDEEAAGLVTFLWAAGGALFQSARARRRRTQLFRNFQALASGAKG